MLWFDFICSVKSVFLGVSLENFRPDECCSVVGIKIVQAGEVQSTNRVKWEQLHKSYNVNRLRMWETKAAHLVGVHTLMTKYIS